MITTDYTDHIDRFLSVQMEPEEDQWFRKELLKNPTLEHELIFHQNMKDAILEEDVLMLREVLEFAHHNYEQRKVKEHPAVARTPKKRLLVAAVIAAMMATGFLAWFIAGRNVSNRQLYDMYYKPYKVTMNVRSATAEQDKLLRDALVLYEKGSFAEAIPLFEQVLQKNKLNHAASLYSGISYMELQNYHAAALAFQRIMDVKNNLYLEQAEWYAGLCYLVADNRDKAIKQFSKIVARDGYYRKQAEEILNKIK